MLLELFIGIATLTIALNGLLYQPKKDPNKPISWKNINNTGKIIILLLIVITTVSVIKSEYEHRESRAELLNRENKINELLASQAQLQKINQHLIKVMSVADGYNSIIRGAVSFKITVTDSDIKSALQNLFLKYSEIHIAAENDLGHYYGKIDYAAHPEVRRYIRLSDLGEDSEYYRYKELGLPNSFYFEIRCSRIKILNEDKIQYARFRSDEMIKIDVNTFEWSRDFNRIYKVNSIFLDSIEIEELGLIELSRTLNF